MYGIEGEIGCLKEIRYFSDKISALYDSHRKGDTISDLFTRY